MSFPGTRPKADHKEKTDIPDYIKNLNFCRAKKQKAIINPSQNSKTKQQQKLQPLRKAPTN